MLRGNKKIKFNSIKGKQFLKALFNTINCTLQNQFGAK